MAGKWIKVVTDKMQEKGTKGALRKQLGAKKGEPISKRRLSEAAKKGGKLGKRAQFALNANKKIMRAKIPVKFILTALGAALRFTLTALDKRKKKRERDDAVL